MTATTTPTKHLSPEERADLIAHLREFGQRQAESQQIADQGSLDRAAELMRLYEDKSWMEELSAPSPRSKVPADDFRRFTKWVLEENRLGLKRTHLGRLRRADEMVQIATLASGSASEYALRPLYWMVTNDYADRMGDVWRDAVQLADGETPSESEVRRALSGWKKRNLRKQERTAGPKSKGAIAQAREWKAKLRGELEQNPEVYGPMLEQLIAEYEVVHRDGPKLAGVDY